MVIKRFSIEVVFAVVLFGWAPPLLGAQYLILQFDRIYVLALLRDETPLVSSFPYLATAQELNSTAATWFVVSVLTALVLAVRRARRRSNTFSLDGSA